MLQAYKSLGERRGVGGILTCFNAFCHVPARCHKFQLRLCSTGTAADGDVELGPLVHVSAEAAAAILRLQPSAGWMS